MARPCNVVLPSPARAWWARWGTVALLCVAVLAAGGCGADFKPMAFPDEGENPTGPGLLTGEAGEWVILRKESRSPTPSRDDDFNPRDAE
jgi:hypothetical protein